MTKETLGKATQIQEEIERYTTILEIFNTSGSVRLTIGNIYRSIPFFPKYEFKSKLVELFKNELEHLQKEFDAL